MDPDGPPPFTEAHAELLRDIAPLNIVNVVTRSSTNLTSADMARIGCVTDPRYCSQTAGVRILVNTLFTVTLGKKVVTCLGNANMSEAIYNMWVMSEYFSHVLGREIYFHDLRAYNALAILSLPRGVDVAAFAALPGLDISYHPDLIRAATYKHTLAGPDGAPVTVTMNVWPTGKVVVTGARSLAILQAAVNEVVPLLVRFSVAGCAPRPATYEAADAPPRPVKPASVAEALRRRWCARENGEERAHEEAH